MSPSSKLEASQPADRAELPEPDRVAGARSLKVQLAGLVAEFGCTSVLEPGLDPDTLPELVQSAVKIDFAVIHGPKPFEDAFVEFLYLDRMLAIGGILVLAIADHRAAASLQEYIAQARAYELRSAAGSELTVLRKLARLRARNTPFPVAWETAGPRLGPQWANGLGNGSRLDPSPDRELHLARVRAHELEARVGELGARLLDAEQRASELLSAQREIGALREQLIRCQAAHRQTEYWLTHLNTSASWRLTTPLRAAKRHVRTLFGR